MSNIFTKNDPPFIFMILLAAFSWAISYIASKTIEKPIIEVEHSVGELVSKDIVICSGSAGGAVRDMVTHGFILTNISKDRLFVNLSFLVTISGGEIYGVRVRALSPAVPGDTPESCSEGYGSFANVTLHPGWQHEISVVSDRNAELSLRLSSAPSAVNLKESNIETWVVRNESVILVGFLTVLSIFIVLYLIYIWRKVES